MKANILHTLRSLHNDESGQDLIEYALVAALIMTAAIAAMGTLSTGLNNAFSKVASTLISAA